MVAAYRLAAVDFSEDLPETNWKIFEEKKIEEMTKDAYKSSSDVWLIKEKYQR